MHSGSAPLFFAYAKSRFSHDVGHFNSRIDHYKTGDKTSIFKMEHEEKLGQLQKLPVHQNNAKSRINDIFIGAESRADSEQCAS